VLAPAVQRAGGLGARLLQCERQMGLLSALRDARRSKYSAGGLSASSPGQALLQGGGAENNENISPGSPALQQGTPLRPKALSLTPLSGRAQQPAGRPHVAVLRALGNGHTVRPGRFGHACWCVSGRVHCKCSAQALNGCTWVRSGVRGSAAARPRPRARPRPSRAARASRRRARALSSAARPQCRCCARPALLRRRRAHLQAPTRGLRMRTPCSLPARHQSLQHCCSPCRS